MQSHSPRFSSQTARSVIAGLLLGLIPVTGCPTAYADILRAGAAKANNPQRAAQARQQAGAEAAAMAQQTSKDRLARTTQALNAMKNMQAAAREAAMRSPDGAIFNKNNPRQQFPRVTDGLSANGLSVDALTPRWENAGPPQQTVSNGKTTVKINQNAQQAVLHWRKFNVGKNTTVEFDQRLGGPDAGKWIAFNKVNDPTGNPSQILGSIKAQGQVYVVNPNGIIFGGSSQVNTRTLVASALPINDNLIARGLLNNPDAQFLFSALNQPGGADGTPVFEAPALPAGGLGDVIVRPGARLVSEQGGDGNGGRVMLVGPRVLNEGTISTPGGQTILAAGLQVGVAAHSQNDPSLRGLDVWIGAVGQTQASVSNTGLIEAPSGSILMAGKTIEQSGLLESSTSVSLNGRVDLLASYGAVSNPNFDVIVGSEFPPFVSQFTGELRLGPASQIRILPDLVSGSRIPGTRLPQNSRLNIDGNIVSFAGTSSVIVPSGEITVRSGTWGFRDTNGSGTTLGPDGRDQPGLSDQFVAGAQRFLLSGGQVYVDRGALIDASGTPGAFAPIEQNILTVQLRGSELADSPLQRSSSLRGADLVVDLRRTGTYGGREWVGTPLGDLTGLAGLVERDAAQLTTRGGNISIRSGGSIVVNRGATVDVSGGFTVNEAGPAETTRLMRGGRMVDIHQATPDLVYEGIYSATSVRGESNRWGVVERFALPLAPSGARTTQEFVEGAAAGVLSFTSPSMVLAGELLGKSIAGPRQLENSPQAGTLRLAFRGERRLDLSATTFRFLDISPAPPDVVFGPGGIGSVPKFTLSQSSPGDLPSGLQERFQVNNSWFEEEANGGGFASLDLDNRDGRLLVEPGQEIRLPAGGSLVARVANATIAGQISVPGGDVSISAFNFSPFEYDFLDATGGLNNLPAPEVIEGRGEIRVSSTGSIRTTGMVVDERELSGAVQQDRFVLNGGSIFFEGYDIRLAKGSVLDASGGVLAPVRGALRFGRGGDISLLAGRDPELSTSTGGTLELSGSLSSLSASRGGALALRSDRILIGGHSTEPGVLVLRPEFFRKGGFTAYNLTGIGSRNALGEVQAGVSVLPNTVIRPVAETLRVARTGASDGGIASSRVLLPEGERPATSVSLTATGWDDPFTENIIEAPGTVFLGEGAGILTDAGASVTVRGDTVAVLGEIRAPGGRIAVTGRSSYRLAQDLAPFANQALPTVYLGPRAHLSAAGKFVPIADRFSRTTGSLFSGGSIVVGGNIIAEHGAVLDVSGSSVLVDVHPSRLNSNLAPGLSATAGLTSLPWRLRTVPVRLDSNAGLIELNGAQMLYSDATLRGRSGGPTAVGGTVSISSGRFYASGEDRSGADINLVVEQTGDAGRFGMVENFGNVPDLFTGRITESSLFVNGSENPGTGYFAISQFEKGGFDSLDLGYKYFEDASPIPFGGNVEFRGPVQIRAKGAVRVAAGGVVAADSSVGIVAPYVVLGQQFSAPLNPSDPFVPFRRFNSATGATPQDFVTPDGGTGRLQIFSRHIDVGTLAASGIGSVVLDAGTGDIRGNGVVSLAGDLRLSAAQIYPTTLGRFDVFAYDLPDRAGSITITSRGSAALPLSAGGTMGMYASTIVQKGVLRAPLGSIILGWDGNDLNPFAAGMQAPENPVAGGASALPVTQNLTLAKGSQTSVSAVDPATGQGIRVPFGLSPDGITWVDPRGVEVSVSGLPANGVSLRGESIAMDRGATVDLRGGGDLLAYRWIAGPGGSVDITGTANSQWSAGQTYNAGDLVLFGGQTWSARVRITPGDFSTVPEPSESRFWTRVPQYFAVLPDYAAAYAPFNPFNTGPNSGSLSGDPGYVSRSLRFGQQLDVVNGSALPPGSYTLLPPRYGVFPGAYLVRTSPDTSGGLAPAANGNLLRPDGSAVVSGRINNPFQNLAESPLLLNRFEVLSPDAVAARAEYEILSMNEFAVDAAERLGVARRQSLPMDAARLAIHGNTELRLFGNVLTAAPRGGRGSEIDISSFAPLELLGERQVRSGNNASGIRTALLNAWGAESLLIGGQRVRTPDGIFVDVRSGSVALNNAGTPLSGPEIVLVARQLLEMKQGSSLASTGRIVDGARPLNIVGDGAAALVSSDENSAVLRTGVTDALQPLLRIGAGTSLSGRAVQLDSSFSSDLHPSLRLNTRSLSLGSGQISVVFQPGGSLAGSEVDRHLVLTGGLLDEVSSVGNLRLNSYRTIDFYGQGTFGRSTLDSLDLSAAGIRGFDVAGGSARVQAGNIRLANPLALAMLPAPAAAPSGEVVFSGQVVRLGQGDFSVLGYRDVVVRGTRGILAEEVGTFFTPGNLSLFAPLLTGGQGAQYSIRAGGDVVLTGESNPKITTALLEPGFGAQISLTGASLDLGGRIDVPSGALKLTASSGDLNIRGTLNTAGSFRDFYDRRMYADAGLIELTSETGDVTLYPGSRVSVAAQSGGGSAGSLVVRAPEGAFGYDGRLEGSGGMGGTAGRFFLDAGTVASLDLLSAKLDSSGFFEQRDLRVRTGDLTLAGTTRVRQFSLTADGGDILVTGSINASGLTGGRILLTASGDLVLDSTASLSVAGRHFSSAGKGGLISLQAGAAVNGVADAGSILELRDGSMIDLSVGDFVAGDFLAPGSSAFQGRFEGTLNLRAPRLAQDVAIAPIGSDIVGGSAVTVEPFAIYEPAGGVLDIALRNQIHSDNTAYMAASESTIRGKLLSGAGNPALAELLVVTPGVEVINRSGDLTLGLANPTGSNNQEALAAADWDLSGYRYGTRNAPGVLTLRASGDIIFNNTLSDGFVPIAQGSAQNFADSGHSLLWLGRLKEVDPLLPVNTQSWSYRLTAGADLISASYRSVLGTGALAAGKGSVLVGEFYPQVPNSTTTGGSAGIGRDGQTADTIRISNTAVNRGTRYEVVRTGTGDIEVNAGRDVQLRNPFATIYTAGVGVVNRASVFQPGDFSVPITELSGLQHPNQGGSLGAIQQSYGAYYGLAGGDLRVRAGADIGRFTRINGEVVPEASGQLPTNWLYRRGLLDQDTGLFARGGVGNEGLGAVNDPSASTTWWVDYSNFFQGFGALGGGDVEMVAGRDLVNADAVIPTNARMAGIDPATGRNLAPSEANLLEYGGGDLTLRAGRNIDGGIFYVEKGAALLAAGNEITTNSAQSPSRGALAIGGNAPEVLDPLTWQAITLFGGRTNFQLSARGNILLGPATTAFLLPQGLNNKFWYKTQFQTIDGSSGVRVTSIGGDITHRLAVTLPGDVIALPTLAAYYRQTSAISPGSRGFYRPWLRIAETNIQNFNTVSTISLPSNRSTAFSGNIRVAGQWNLFPSPTGGLELLAAQGVTGINPVGRTEVVVDGTSVPVTAWASSRINLSDANPARVPGVLSPVGFQQLVNSRESLVVRDSPVNPTATIVPLFAETGSVTGLAASVEVKAALHAAVPVHLENPDPLRIYAAGGDITGFTLFSPKKLLTVADRDITDIAFYLQHVSDSDVSVVSAGRDVIPFNERAPLRSIARNIDARNILVDPAQDTVLRDASNRAIPTQAIAGDFQVGGKGTLQILAGRNLDLGTGPNFVDGTGVGITSIGRLRNPFLAFEGAGLLVFAGIKNPSGGPALGLTGSDLNFPAVRRGLSFDSAENRAIAEFRGLFADFKTIDPNSGADAFAPGYAAIEKIFGTEQRSGELLTRARDIRTTSGGEILVGVPGGGISMASDIFGNPLTPPGIVTEFGGEVGILTSADVDIGAARIFTLRGGDLTIWSSNGNIAAGNAPKTVVTAPPTRVLVDATSADVLTDLGGLATGGGIGVLAAVEGVRPGSVSLLAPRGTIDAGDAGIRATGDISLAALTVVNADNISAGGNTAGTGVSAPPSVPAPSAPAATNPTGATTAAAETMTTTAPPPPETVEEAPSLFTVEVLGYGGGEQEEEDERDSTMPLTSNAPPSQDG